MVSAHGNDAVRRTWDEARYARRAAERRLSSGVGKRSRHGRGGGLGYLEAHARRVDLDARVGSTTVVSGGRDRRGGFWCDVCESLLKDSNAWLNHINGRRHQRMLGRGMRVRRSTGEDVREKLRKLREERSLDNRRMESRFESGKRTDTNDVQSRMESTQQLKNVEDGSLKEENEREADVKTSKREDDEVEGEADDDRRRTILCSSAKKEGIAEENEEDYANWRESLGLPTGFGSSKAR